MKQTTRDAIDNLASIADLVQEAREASHLGVMVGRPSNGITAKEYSMETGFSVSAAKRHLDALVDQERYELIAAIAPTMYGTAKRVTKQMFYRKVQR